MKDTIFRSALWMVAFGIFLLFSLLLVDVFSRGMLFLDTNFLTEIPENAGRSGGIAPIIASTGLVLMITLVITIPLGLTCALWLTDYAQHDSRLARWTLASLDALAGVPSIVLGLFGNAFFSVFLGLGFSILSGGLTLSCMALPLFIQTTAKGLQALGQDLRKQGEALGITRLTLIRVVLLPAAKPAILAGTILSIGRATAETAALIFTSGYSDRWPSSVADGGRTLAVHIYDLSMNVTGGDDAAYASALVLMILIILTNTCTAWISARFLDFKGVRT